MLKRIFKQYNSLPGYLERYTIFKIGRLHVRLHRIKSDDGTPFLHTHPFHYISIIIRGGYTEQGETRKKRFNALSVLCRRNDFFHRLIDVDKRTTTIFISWNLKGAGWTLKNTPDSDAIWKDYPPGVYVRMLSGKARYCKFDRFWHVGSDSVSGALLEKRPSINQKTPGNLIHLFRKEKEQ